jgi:hypothetical protein
VTTSASYRRLPLCQGPWSALTESCGLSRWDPLVQLTRKAGARLWRDRTRLRSCPLPVEPSPQRFSQPRVVACGICRSPRKHLRPGRFSFLMGVNAGWHTTCVGLPPCPSCRVAGRPSPAPVLSCRPSARAPTSRKAVQKSSQAVAPHANLVARSAPVVASDLDTFPKRARMNVIL